MPVPVKKKYVNDYRFFKKKRKTLKCRGIYYHNVATMPLVNCTVQNKLAIEPPLCFCFSLPLFMFIHESSSLWVIDGGL
jgi:hypothetical protein